MIDLSQDGVGAARVMQALLFDGGRRSTRLEAAVLRGGVRLCALRLLDFEVACDALSAVKYTGRFTAMADERIDWRGDLIEPAMTVEVGGRTLRYPFPRLKAQRVRGEGTLAIEAADETALLAQSSLGERPFIPAGTKYVPYIERRLLEAGFPGAMVEPGEAAFACEREDWEPEESLLSFLNGLLGEIGYETLQARRGGVLGASRYRPPQQARGGISYRAGAGSVLLPQRERELDGYMKPNRFVGVVSNPDMAPMRCEIADNDPSSPTSPLRNGGYVLTAVRRFDHVSDGESLRLNVRRWAEESRQQYETVLLRTAPMPHHEVGETVSVDAPGMCGTFTEVGWTIAGGVMTHRLRRASDG